MTATTVRAFQFRSHSGHTSVPPDQHRRHLAPDPSKDCVDPVRFLCWRRRVGLLDAQHLLVGLVAPAWDDVLLFTHGNHPFLAASENTKPPTTAMTSLS